MGLEATIASGIAVAASATASLQETITITPWTGNAVSGGPSYGAAYTTPALVEWGDELIGDAEGRTVMANGKVTITKPITAIGSPATRREPVDPKDKITLTNANNAVVSIVSVKGLVNPSINAPYMFEIWFREGE